MKNILITFTNAIDPTTGGVERVYHNLVPYFREHGYNVFATYQRKTDYDKNSVYTKAIFMEYSIDNVGYFDKLDKVMMEMAVDIVICPFPSYQLFNYCSRLIDKKVFFHVHNVPSKLMYPSSAKLPNILKESFVDRCLKRIRFDLRYLASFRRIELNKMKIVLLSDFFRDDLKSFYDFNPKCICALPNPFCIDEEYQLDYKKKEKMILYVGRINTRQKRFQSLLNIWKRLQNELLDYRLEIVGGGPEKELYENLAHEMRLKRITFHDFQNPTEYYKKAVCSCMTSNYEGFSMVLIEAMQYGCVPFVFNSFASLPDIIDDKVNGYVITPFDEGEYVQKIKEFILLSKKNKEIISVKAMEKSREFDVRRVGQRWIELIDNY